MSRQVACLTDLIEYGIFREGSHISTNQKRENGAFSPLIGQNMITFPENTVLCRVRYFRGRASKFDQSEQESTVFSIRIS